MLPGLTSATISSMAMVLLIRRSLAAAATALGSTSADVVFVVEQLPLEVVQLDEVAVHQPQVAHARAAR